MSKKTNVILRETKNLMRSFTNVQDDNQAGRSMVEMLGVLAVMGVLSVGGVAMYTSAMNKYRANEILNEASKRAVMVAGQLLTNPSATTMPLSQFGSNTVAGGTFGENATISNGKITLTVSGVESAVCTQMKAATGTNSVMSITGDCGSDLTIAFASDMSKDNLSSEEGQKNCTEDASICNECQTCVDGTCVAVDNSQRKNCSTGTDGLCVDGECVDCSQATTSYYQGATTCSIPACLGVSSMINSSQRACVSTETKADEWCKTVDIAHEGLSSCGDVPDFIGNGISCKCDD